MARFTHVFYLAAVYINAGKISRESAQEGHIVLCTVQHWPIFSSPFQTCRQRWTDKLKEIALFSLY